MAKDKARNIVIKMVSMANTGYFYTTTKNPRNMTHKLVLRKYDPIIRQHVLFQVSMGPDSQEERISRAKVVQRR